MYPVPHLRPCMRGAKGGCILAGDVSGNVRSSDLSGIQPAALEVLICAG